NSGTLEISQGNSVILDGRYSLLNHTHTISDITGLQSALDGKENTFSKGNIVEGNNVTITGTLTNRLVGSGNITINAQDTTYNAFTRSVDGLVVAPGGTTTNRYLREDGTWVIPPNNDTTYSAGQGITLTGTTFSVAAGAGLTQQTGGLAFDSTYGDNR